MTATRPNAHPNREAWLADVAGRLRPVFATLGAPLPDRLRIAIGFPSTGRRVKATGECWDSAASADGTVEIFIRPDLAEAADPAGASLALPVAAALARELVTAAIGAGNPAAFRKLALGIGLTGSKRATAPGPAFVALASPIIEAAGPLPHARLRPDAKPGAPGDETAAAAAPRKSAGRHIKCACPACGYLVRTARKWLDQVGPPHCPKHGPMRPDPAAAETMAADEG